LIKFRGRDHEQIFERSGWTWLEPLYFDFEKHYDPQAVQDVMKSMNMMVYGICIGYVLFVLAAKMDKKNLKYPIALWNFLLSTFSLYGAIRTVPELISQIASKPFENTICDRPDMTWGAGASGLAVQLFILSKMPELVDTMWLVIKGSPIIFLHWYHHFTVLAFCWNSYITEAGAGLYFVAMNYSVHSIMYFYYFNMGLKGEAAKIEGRMFGSKPTDEKKVKAYPLGKILALRNEEKKNSLVTYVVVPLMYMAYSVPPMFITAIQITQMIVGTFIVGSSIYYYREGGQFYKVGECNNTPENLAFGFTIYSSYLVLFVLFFLNKYFGGGTKKNVSDVKKGN